MGLFEKGYFDFVYSRLVLQHIPPVYSQQYVKEFIRVLKPGGLAAFQVPISLQLFVDDQAIMQPFLKPSVLFQVVHPHQEITTTLPITAPVYPGSYLLELDLVQEQVAWFSDKGNPTLQIPVQVTGQPLVEMATPSPSVTHRVRNRFQKWWNRILPPPVQPSFEMYGVPASQLIPLIHQNGADLLAIQQDSSAHRDWMSYFYFICKRSR